MKCSLVILNFLEEISSLPLLLNSSISLHWSLRKAFLSLLPILWNSAFKWVYLSSSSLPLASLFFSDICKASSDNSFAWRQEEKWTTEDEMFGWHHRLNGQSLSKLWELVMDLVCCNPWGCKELDMTEWLNWTDGGQKSLMAVTFLIY